MSEPRMISASRPLRPTAPAAIAMDCGEITLAVVPPAVLVPTSRAGLAPMPSAVATCSGANSVLLLTTEPVRNTPIQPMMGANSGKIGPAAASAVPMAVEPPE